MDNKAVYSKDIGNRKASSEKVNGFLADFALSLLLLFTKFYKKRFSIYFLKIESKGLIGAVIACIIVSLNFLLFVSRILSSSIT